MGEGLQRARVNRDNLVSEADTGVSSNGYRQLVPSLERRGKGQTNAILRFFLLNVLLCVPGGSSCCPQGALAFITACFMDCGSFRKLHSSPGADDSIGGNGPETARLSRVTLLHCGTI